MNDVLSLEAALGSAETLSDLLGPSPPAAAPNAIPSRTYWSCYQYDEGGKIAGLQTSPHQSEKPEDNFLVSSLCEDGTHAPVIDFDFWAATEPQEDGTTKLVLKSLKEGGIPLQCRSSLYPALVFAFVRAGLIPLEDIPRHIALHFDAWHLEAAQFFIRAPIRLIPSSTNGHFHLYIDRPMSWTRYEDLLRALHAWGQINRAWFNSSIDRKASFVIRPELTKAQVDARIAPKRSNMRAWIETGS